MDDSGDRLLDRWIFPMVRVGEEYLLPRGEAAWAEIRAGGGYEPEFFPFLERSLTALAEDHWAAGSYFPGGYYRQVRAAGGDPLTAPITEENLRPFYREELRVDRQGKWFLGQRHVRGRVLRFFLKHLHRDRGLHRYYVRYRLGDVYERCYLRDDSPPLRVVAIEPAGDTLRVVLNDGTREPLRGERLWLDRSEELHCPVRAEGLPARFAQAPRWEILKNLDEREGRWVVPVGGREITLLTAPP